MLKTEKLMKIQSHEKKEKQIYVKNFKVTKYEGKNSTPTFSSSFIPIQQYTRGNKKK